MTKYSYEERIDMIKKYYPYTDKEGKELLAKELGYKNGNTLRVVASREGISGNYNLPDLEGEEWRKSKNYPNYLFSNKGRVKSLHYGGILKQRVHEGYKDCRIKDRRGNKKTITIHRMIAKLFVERPEGKYMVNHKDSNKLNNNSNNLEWVTDSENVKHYLRNNIPCSKFVGTRLSRDEVEDICERLEIGESIKDITSIKEEYTRARVEKIRQRITYKHITKNYRWITK